MSPVAGAPTNPARSLLAAAGLPADDAEAASFEAAYPGLRASADALFLPLIEAEEIPSSLTFTAAFDPIAEGQR